MTRSGASLLGAALCALTLAAAGCDDGGARLILVYPDQEAYDRARQVEVYVREGRACAPLQSPGPEPHLVFDARDDAPSLGQVQTGRSAFLAQVRAVDCDVFLSGCVEQTLEPRQDAAVRIVLLRVEGTGCGAELRCLAGHCVTGDAALVDARAADGGALDSADLDAARGDLPTPDQTTPDVSPAELTLEDARGLDALLPDVALSDAPSPDAPSPDALLADTTLPDALLPDAALPDAALPDTALPDTSQPDAYVMEPVVTLIAQGSVWRYLDDGSDQGTVWRGVGFSDSGWASGPAQLGYGDGDEATVVSFGPDLNDKYVTTYFRRSFAVQNAGAVNLLVLRLLRDDGAVVYVNGVEAARSNLPSGTISYNTRPPAYVEDDGAWFNHFAIDPGLLVEGQNTIAAEVHQHRPSSSDISFDLELLAFNQAPVHRSCRAALRAGITTSEVVLLDPDGAAGPNAPYPAWCEQELAGGGWALALKVDGELDTFLADAAAWTGGGLINATNLGPLNTEEAVLAPYLDQRVGSVLLAMGARDDPFTVSPQVVSLRAPSLYAAMAAGNFLPTSAPEASWRALLPATSMQSYCPRQGINNRTGYGDTLLRVGLTGNNENDCLSNDSWLGIGAMHDCSDTTMHAAGNVVSHGLGADQGLTCQAAFAWIFVRDDDFTDLPAEASCADHLLQGQLESGTYLIDPAGTGAPVAVRCDMERAGGGWTALIDFDPMEDPCPAPLQPASGSGAPVGCGLAATDASASLGAMTAPLPAFQEVMGHALAYQYGSMDAFGYTQDDIDDNYVDGISITIGAPRRHLMTFGVGMADATAGCAVCACPCAGGAPAHAFVNDDYRCESGVPADSTAGWYTLDPVWDGYDVPSGAGCATEASGAPLVVDLGAPTSDPIEVRLLRDEPPASGDEEGLALYRLELYVR